MGMMPTHKSAVSNDYLYRYFQKKEYEEYWTIVANILNLDLGTISEDFFHLVTTMMKYDFQRRLTIDEIKEHPWFNGPVATQEEVQIELNSRKLEINKKLYSDGENPDDEIDPDEIVGSHKTAFEEVTRGDGDSDEEDFEDAPLRKLKIYDATAPKLTEFFSTFKPDVLLGALVNFARNNKKIDIQVEKYKYKALVQMPSEEENIVDFVVEIQKVKQGEEAKDTLFADSDDDECLETVSEDDTSNQAY
jgi:serine/threonine protein kinase